MANSRDNDGASSSFHKIMEKVSVKISEQYRPPSKIIISSGILHKRHAEDFTKLYEFSLEKSIINKMGQMKELRNQLKTDRKELINEQQSKLKEQLEGKNNEIIESPTKTTIINTIDSEKLDIALTINNQSDNEIPLTTTTTTTTEEQLQLNNELTISPLPINETKLNNTPISSPNVFNNNNNETTTIIQNTLLNTNTNVINTSNDYNYQININTTINSPIYNNTSYIINTSSNISNTIPYNTNTYSSNSNNNITNNSVILNKQISSLSYIPNTIPISSPIVIQNNNDMLAAHENDNELLNHVKKKLNKFNISDFESESSPFDNMELKSINDIEELAHVLEQSSKYNIKTELIQHHNNIETNSGGTGSGLHHNTNNSGNNVHHNTNNNMTTYHSNETTTPSSSSFNPFDSEIRTGSYNNNNSLYNSTPLYLQNYNSDYQHNGAALHSNDITSTQPSFYSINNSKSQSDYSISNNNSSNQSSSSIPPPPPPQQTTPPNTSDGGGAKTTKLPTILNELKNEILKKREDEINKQNEVAALHSPDYSSSSSSESDRRSPLPPLSMSYLPNPYLSLSPKGQEIVDKVSDMGFLQSRAARGCEIFGEDQHQIVEFVIHVYSLEDKFQIDGDRCELALILNKFHPKNTVKYLQQFKKFINIGFHEDKVIEALSKYDDMDSEKILDFLVS